MQSSKRARLVLLVDDSIDIQTAMTFLLEVNGFEVRCAENGLVALEALRASDRLPDVIILDMMMPIMDGVGFRKEQMMDPRLAKIPTILLTALSRASLNEIKDVSFPLILNKPVSIDELLAAIQKASPDEAPR